MRFCIPPDNSDFLRLDRFADRDQFCSERVQLLPTYRPARVDANHDLTDSLTHCDWDIDVVCDHATVVPTPRIFLLTYADRADELSQDFFPVDLGIKQVVDVSWFVPAKYPCKDAALTQRTIDLLA